MNEKFADLRTLIVSYHRNSKTLQEQEEHEAEFFMHEIKAMRREMIQEKKKTTDSCLQSISFVYESMEEAAKLLRSVRTSVDTDVIKKMEEISRKQSTIAL